MASSKQGKEESEMSSYRSGCSNFIKRSISFNQLRCCMYFTSPM